MPVVIDHTDELVRAFDALRKKRLLIGIPAENNPRPDAPAVAGKNVGNAQIGYWQEFGTVTIPARPFLIPGVAQALPAMAAKLADAVKAALTGNTGAIDQALGEAGTLAVRSVTRRIRSGIPPPLAQVTIDARRVRLPGVHYRIRARLATDPQFRKDWMARHPEYKTSYRRRATSPARAIPLIDTGSLLRSITWAIRQK